MFMSQLASRRILALPLICAATLLIGVTGPPSASAAETPVSLGTADNFAVLAASTVTNTGGTTIEGDLGLSPGTSVTGFSPGQVAGGVYVADGVAAQAQADLVTAYDDAAARTTTATIPTELGGTTVTPGVYDSASGTFEITGTLTLDAQGDPYAVFIFKTASTLVTASASTVVLANDARSSGVFWGVGSSATLGTNSAFLGNILAMASITVTTGVVLTGRALARTAAVTLDSNTITRPADLPQSIINTTTALETSVNPALADEPITFTATVTPESGATAPTGVVVFIDKRTVIGTGVLDSLGVATFTTSTLSVSRHSIKASYLGADGFLESTSSTLSQVVTSIQ
jgi:hypothetical protein